MGRALRTIATAEDMTLILVKLSTVVHINSATGIGAVISLHSTRDSCSRSTDKEHTSSVV